MWPSVIANQFQCCGPGQGGPCPFQTLDGGT